MRENVRKSRLCVIAICLGLIMCAVCALTYSSVYARDAVIEQGWTRYEIESGRLIPGDRVGRITEDDKASGGKAWVDVDAMGASVILKVTAPEMGMYPVRLLGATDHDNPSMRLWNEEGYCAELVLKTKTGWGEYAETAYAEGKIPLKAGVNTLILRKGDNAFQVDALDVGEICGTFVLPGKESVRGVVEGEITKYEVEYAKIVTAKLGIDVSETSSGAYVSDMNWDTSKINLPVFVDADGEYEVKIRYASDQSEQNLSLFVDSTFACHAVSEGSTGGWNVFTKDMTAKLMLKAGYNMIDIGLGNVGNACVDFITVNNTKTDNAYAKYTPNAEKTSVLPEVGYTRFEAENADTNKYNMIEQGIFALENRGNTGYGYISDMQNADARITFTLPNVPTDGEYAVKLRYASKNATTSFVCTVNDNAEATVSFNSLSNVDTQDKFVASNTITANVALKAGTNTLKFTQGILGGAPNMEQFDGIDVSYTMESVGIDFSSIKTTLAKGIDSLDVSKVSAIVVSSDMRKTVLGDAIKVEIFDSENKPVTTLGQDAAEGVYKVRLTASTKSVDITVTVAAVTTNINTEAVATAIEKTTALTLDAIKTEVEKAVFEVTANNEKNSYAFDSGKWSYTIKKGNQEATSLTAGIYTAELSLTNTAVKKSFDITIYEAKSAVAITEGLTLSVDYGKTVADLEKIIKSAKLSLTLNDGATDSVKELAFASNSWTYAVAKGGVNVDLSNKNAVLGSGAYNVTLTYSKNSSVNATFDITVAAQIIATSIKLNKTDIEIKQNETLNLSGITVTLVNSDNSESVLEAAAFTVDQSKLKTDVAGTYEIIFTYKDNPSITAKLMVKVVAEVKAAQGCTGTVGSASGLVILLVASLGAVLVIRKRKSNKA